jgi:chromosome segregation protein
VLLEEKEQKRRLLDVAKDNLHNAEKNIANEQGNLDKLTQQKQQAELDKQSFLLKSEAALAPLAELNRPLKEVLDELPQDTKLTHLQAMLGRTSTEIAGLGAINLAAVEEFDKASERKVYLDQQYDDLTTALSTLETAITKIDRETKQRFKGTFDQINAGLQNLFPKVFGGGHAYLELTSDDLLDTGVTIMARPPGKKNATIHLLSGGEKALTALSLVFSIFQLNPAPFCMLDEVDAPLDDANVGRFCRLVDEMSQDVQFIYISHNKISMEMAGRLTGVTMAEPGVSRVVAVDIEKALEMTQTA